MHETDSPDSPDAPAHSCAYEAIPYRVWTATMDDEHGRPHPSPVVGVRVRTA